jgi:hypothetical protein
LGGPARGTYTNMGGTLANAVATGHLINGKGAL